MTFVEALYSGQRYIRVPYQRGETKGFFDFDTKEDSISELTMLHSHEMNSDTWEVSEDGFFETIGDMS